MTDKKKNPDTQKPKKDYLIDDESMNMDRKPKIEDPDYKAAGKLEGKVCLINGGDSGIGAATAILFAKEGADVAFTYFSSDHDADRTRKRLEELGAKVAVLKGDVGEESFAEETIQKVTNELGNLDVLVNHAGEQHVKDKIGEITAEQLDRTFRTNVYSMFYAVKAALPYLNPGASIINTTSVTAYKGNPKLIDYSATNGAVTTFTRSLSQNPEILDKNIRVNMVAPGPIWTPLIPATFTQEELKSWGKDGAMERPGEAYEVAPAYVYLASKDSSYVTGQTLHVNGGLILNA